MTNKFATVLCACLMSVTALAHGIHAEDYEDVPDEAPPAAVEEAASEETPAPAAEDVARVPVEIDAPTPEPTEAPTIWDKPFNDYTPTEGLLLLTFVALCFLALLIWLR